jgi:hypothetical protein
VSTADGTTPGDGPSEHPAVANNGLYVAFSSTAANLGASAPNPAALQEVFDRSTCITAASGCTAATNLVSTPDGATPADGASIQPSISSDGRFIAFASTATNLGVAAGGVQQIYVADACVGVAAANPPTCTPFTAPTLVSTSDAVTPANAASENPSINVCGATTTACQGGHFIAFASKATNLGANVTNGIENIFARNTCLGLATTTACATYTFLASQPAGILPSPANGDSIIPAISGDGKAVSFISSASNLVGGDTNAIPDIFLAGATPSFNITVALQGSGSGTVIDNQSKISCTLTAGTQTGTCSAKYLYGDSVALTETPVSPSTFGGWGGSVTATQCPATATTCSVTVVGDNNITATFQ